MKIYRNDYTGAIEQWKVDMIRRQGKRRGLRDIDLQDVEQDTVLELMELKNAFPNISIDREKVLVSRVISNSITDFKRKKKLRDAESLDLSIHDQAVNTEEAVDLRLDLEMAFEKQPKRLREVWTLLQSGYNYEEGAKILGINKKTFVKDVKRLREVLAPIYRDYFGEG